MKKSIIKFRLVTLLLAVWTFLAASGCERLPFQSSDTGSRQGGYDFLIPSGSDDLEQNRQKISYTPKNFDEIRAVWVSYIELKTLLTGKNQADFTSCIRNAFQNAKELGLNTVVVHVRPYGDAVYQSGYFPWSSYTGSFGKSPGYDPLSIMLDQAHTLGLSLHAWINPYRAQTEEEAGQVSNEYPFSKWYHGAEKGKYVINLSGRWYYNPGIEAVRQLIVAGVRELVRYYPVDGIHFDDYFYPTTDTTFDADAYQSYRQEGGTLELAAWRRENVNALLRDCYLAVKKENDGVLFGISPQANISNNFNSQYADVIRWCSTPGYLDYICPQIYYSFKSETTDFMKSLAEWSKIAVQPSVRLCIGVAPYKIGKEDRWACTAASGGTCSAPRDCGSKGWMVSEPDKSDILKRQYEEIKKNTRCSGIFFYSYNSLFLPDNSVKTQVGAERNNLKTVLR